jgi:MurNAc alpha-1-phosphate uridylyltransferase
MRAMILAAGRGQRMRPLTDTTPKPLLEVGGKPLIVWHIDRLVAAGLRDIIINHAWLGGQIEQALGAGAAFGARIRYSPEAPGGLETAGGIVQALPFFEDQPFLVVNGDIWCDWDPSAAVHLASQMEARGALAWLLLVDNPPQHPEGDFVLGPDTWVADRGTPGTGTALTFAGIGVYQPALFAGLRAGISAPLAPLLRQAMTARQVFGTRHTGAWEDVGTPERLAGLNHFLRSGSRYT